MFFSFMRCVECEGYHLYVKLNKSLCVIVARCIQLALPSTKDVSIFVLWMAPHNQCFKYPFTLFGIKLKHFNCYFKY